ncbi:MAG: GNAT family N-acetyltransferase [Dehalococcoidia bacterium]
MVTVEALTAKDWRNVLDVDVTEEQRARLDFRSMLEFLAEARFHLDFAPCAIRADGEMVGFVSYGAPADDLARWWMPLLIIDRRHQRRGYGRAALDAIVADVRERAPDATALGLSYHASNEAAASLYRSAGFVETEANERGERVAWLPLRQG